MNIAVAEYLCTEPWRNVLKQQWRNVYEENSAGMFQTAVEECFEQSNGGMFVKRAVAECF